MTHSSPVGLLQLLQICHSLSAQPHRALGPTTGQRSVISLGLGFRFPDSVAAPRR